jgi:hypothetical protein
MGIEPVNVRGKHTLGRWPRSLQKVAIAALTLLET